jgi:pyruvate dehydrogenase E1 component alpha subunit
MTELVVQPGHAPQPDGAELRTYLGYYRLMLRIRRCEERIGWLFSRGLTMGTAHLSIGQEASAVGVLAATEPIDYVVSTHRGHGHLLAKGAEPAMLLAEICGRATGYCRGKGGSQHIAVREIGFLGTNGITGGGIPVATGAALSSKLRGTGQVVLCFFGDGAANQGTFHESLNMAAVWGLPVVYVCENNGYAMWTAARTVTSVSSIADRAASYGIPGMHVDGMDLLAVRAAAREAVSRARSGAGPILLETMTYRFCGHSKSENGKGYRPSEEIEQWERADPLPAWKDRLLGAGVPPAEIAAMEVEVEAEIEEATALALNSPYAEQEALLGVYAAATADPLSPILPSMDAGTVSALSAAGPVVPLALNPPLAVSSAEERQLPREAPLADVAAEVAVGE